jgi:calcium-dependent protein kinase
MSTSCSLLNPSPRGYTDLSNPRRSLPPSITIYINAPLRCLTPARCFKQNNLDDHVRYRNTAASAAEWRQPFSTTFFPSKRSFLPPCPHLNALLPHSEMYHTADDPIGTFGFASNFEQDYMLGRQLGSGTFGTVFEAFHKRTGDRFAVKRMPKRFQSPGVLEKYFVRRIRNEVDICNHLGRSLNVAYLYAAYEDEKHIDLVMELCTGGELWDAIRARGGAYSERDAARFTREVIRTVAQCHAAGVLMRDVKPENFLFASSDPGAPLKAIDFGISVFCEPGQEIDLRAGTPIYIAPDVLKQKYSHPADMWSVGIIAYMLLTGRLPFSGEEGDEVAELYMSKHVFNNKDVFRAVLYADLDFTSPPWDVISVEARELVQSLLSREPSARPTAEEALASPWLKNSKSTGSRSGAESGGSGSESDAGGNKNSSGVLLGDTIVQRLQRYGTYGRLKQAALRKVAHAALEQAGSANRSTTTTTTTTSTELPAALQAAFSCLDTQKSGRVPRAALREELCSGRFNLSNGEADQLLSQVDDDEDGSVDWEAWVAAMTEWRALRDSADWDSLVTEAFRTMDRDSDAALGVDDLTALLCGDEGCIDPDIVEAALREADGDHDRTVSLAELRKLLGSHETGLDLFDARVVFDEEEEGVET